jgi:hypothetical protein
MIQQPIVRARGLTSSERYLSALADATFLDLWSYPNTFIDKRSGVAGTGKELCDLLVVCGNDVIIFSDKSICWPKSDDVRTSWARWYRRAVAKSVNQIRGAERWLRKFPDRIFLDPACTQKLPIALPEVRRCRVHGIAVALGAQEACSTHFDGDDGSLVLLPSVKGDAHLTGETPFAIGDVDPDGPFVHVFDETALDLIMREMDTVSDFVRYLNEREQLIRQERLAFAPSEAELIATFMQSFDAKFQHEFPRAETLGGPPDAQLLLTSRRKQRTRAHTLGTN